MGACIKIEISDQPTADIIHRFRNFGEDVYRQLRTTCTVSLEEIDACTTSFTVRDVHRRELRTVEQAIKRELKKHHSDASAILTTS